MKCQRCERKVKEENIFCERCLSEIVKTLKEDKKKLHWNLVKTCKWYEELKKENQKLQEENLIWRRLEEARQGKVITFEELRRRFNKKQKEKK